MKSLEHREKIVERIIFGLCHIMLIIAFLVGQYECAFWFFVFSFVYWITKIIEWVYTGKFDF